MDWKKEAADKLRNYEAHRRALMSIPEEIRRLECDFHSIRSATTDATPVQGGGSTREDMLLSNIALREELARQLEIARIWVDNVDKGLAVLDEQERLVLDRFYIHPQRGATQRLMDELGFAEESSVYKRRRKALRRFTVAYYGGSEN